jgi:hypothetical protein
MAVFSVIPKSLISRRGSRGHCLARTDRPPPLELRDAAQCEDAVRTAADRLGGVDQLETLVVGPWRLVRLVLPLMRAQGRGHIVNVSSLAGRMAFPGLGSYVAGKYALEDMSQALAAEVGGQALWCLSP